MARRNSERVIDVKSGALLGVDVHAVSDLRDGITGVVLDCDAIRWLQSRIHADGLRKGLLLRAGELAGFFDAYEAVGRHFLSSSPYSPGAGVCPYDDVSMDL